MNGKPMTVAEVLDLFGIKTSTDVVDVSDLTGETIYLTTVGTVNVVLFEDREDPGMVKILVHDHEDADSAVACQQHNMAQIMRRTAGAIMARSQQAAPVGMYL